jgi:hypothetical protein
VRASGTRPRSEPLPANLPPSAWEALSRALQQTSGEWRQAHPTATLDQSETVRDTPLAPLRAPLVEATAQASHRRDWQHQEAAKQPSGVTCGAPLVARGHPRRRLQTTGGPAANWSEPLASAPTASRGFSPLDEECGLTSASLTPPALEGLVRLSPERPSGQAAQVLASLTGGPVSEAPARRWTATRGVAACAVQREPAEQIRRALPPAPPRAERLLLRADGALVPLLPGAWAAAQLLVRGEVTTDPAGQTQTSALSSCAPVAEAEIFSQAALVETPRRGLERAGAGCAVRDGAEWLQGGGDDHRTAAGRMRAWAHAARSVGQIGQAAPAAGTPVTPNWLSDPLHRLQHDRPAEGLSEWPVGAQAHPEGEAVQGALASLEQRAGQRPSPTSQAAAWPIGSGSVERGHQGVRQARLTGPGRHGERTQVNPLLPARTRACTDRWAAGWAQLRHGRQRACGRKRPERAEARLVRRWARLLSWRARLHVQVISQRQPTVPPQEPLLLAGAGPLPRRPAASHPWRRAVITHRRLAAKT